jgi:hypothetical protein
MMLGDSLEMCVPFAIHDLVLRGGPSETDRERVRAFSDRFQDEADTVACIAVGYSGKPTTKERHQVAAMFNDMVFAVAVMAFQPAGITMFGRCWDCGRPDITGKAGQIRGLLPGTVALLRLWDEPEGEETTCSSSR